MDFIDGYIEFERNISVGKQGKLIEVDDFENYAQKFGEQRAQGYLDALKDFNAYAEVILGGGFCRNGLAQTGHRVRKNLGEFVDHNVSFLNKMASEKKFEI